MTSPKELKILIANGVNLDLLGQRESDIYGEFTLLDLRKNLESWVIRQPSKNRLIKLTFFQSNDEGEYLKCLTEKKWSGILINPGAWTHTSVALGDRIAALKYQKIPVVEVHISQLFSREAFRHHSYSAPYCIGVVQGFGFNSYILGLKGLIDYIQQI